MSDAVPDLRGGHWKTILAIATPIAGALAMFGGFVWQAAKYPDRPEFDEARREQRATAADLARRVSSMEMNGAVTSAVVNAIKESVTRIENKLDERKRRSP